MKAEIIAVGTELLLGEILDTNSQYLAQQLTGLGIDLFFVTHVGDNMGRLSDTVQRALSRSDVVIMTGGLGPTEDDLTREAIAQALGEEMTVRPELEDVLRTWYAKRNRPMPADEHQAGDADPVGHARSTTRSAPRPAGGSRTAATRSSACRASRTR